MYKVIANEKSLLEWEKYTENDISLWKNENAKKHLQDVVQQLDASYGAERDIEKDLGGYTIVMFGEAEEVRCEYLGILKYHHLNQDEHEYEYKYRQNNEEYEVVFQLYLCSSDYAVVIVMVTG